MSKFQEPWLWVSIGFHFDIIIHWGKSLTASFLSLLLSQCIMTASPSFCHACQKSSLGFFPHLIIILPPPWIQWILVPPSLRKYWRKTSSLFFNQTFLYSWCWSRLHVGIFFADANFLPLQSCTPCLLLKFVTGFNTSCIRGDKLWCLCSKLRQCILFREKHWQLGWDGLWPLLWYYHFEMR